MLDSCEDLDRINEKTGSHRFGYVYLDGSLRADAWDIEVRADSTTWTARDRTRMAVPTERIERIATPYYGSRIAHHLMWGSVVWSASSMLLGLNLNVVYTVPIIMNMIGMSMRGQEHTIYVGERTKTFELSCP